MDQRQSLRHPHLHRNHPMKSYHHFHPRPPSQILTRNPTITKKTYRQQRLFQTRRLSNHLANVIMMTPRKTHSIQHRKIHSLPIMCSAGGERNTWFISSLLQRSFLLCLLISIFQPSEIFLRYAICTYAEETYSDLTTDPFFL